MLVALLLIFAAAIRIDTSSGEQRLLVWLWSSVVNFWDTRWMAAIILLIIVVIFMYFIVNEGRPTKSAHEKKGGD